MVPSQMDSGFPSIGTSFRFHPPTPLFTFNAPIPTLASPAADPNPDTPLSAETYVNFPGSVVTGAPFAKMTVLLSSQSDSPTASPGPTDPVITNSPPQTVGKGIGTISKGAQIGIFACIAVVVILVLLALGLAILSLRRRIKRRQAKKQSRDSELNMWETELRNGRQGVHRDRDRATDRKIGGLWAELKASEARREDDYTEPENRIMEGEAMRSKGTLWERIGERKDEEAKRREENSAREAHAKEQEAIRTYVSRDRTSMVSEGSVGVLGNPVVTTSFLADRK